MGNIKKIKINEEILAVISAATAFVNAKPDRKLVVRPIRRVPQTLSAWNYVGRIENIRRNLNS